MTQDGIFVRQRQLAAKLPVSVLQVFAVASYLEESPVLSPSKSGCVPSWHQDTAIMANCKRLKKEQLSTERRKKRRRRKKK